MGKFYCYHNSLKLYGNDVSEISFTKQELKEAFKKYKKAYFLSYLTDFDCGFDTGWYYIAKDIDDDPLMRMSSKHRNSILKSLNAVECKSISYEEYKDDIVAVGNKNVSFYNRNMGKNNDLYQYGDIFIGAFFKQTNTLVGFEILSVEENYINCITEKVNPDYRKYDISFCLNYHIIMNKRDIASNYDNPVVKCGERNVLHETRHNDFLIERLGFRKVYCRLNILYRPSIAVIMPLIRVLSPLFRALDKINLFHKINGLILMDKIARKQNKMFKKRDSDV